MGYLDNQGAVAAPVWCFPNAPLSTYWNEVAPGFNVEVPNIDVEITHTTVYWIARIIKIAGYRAKLRFLGMEDDSSKDFWVNLCNGVVHRICWAAKANHYLVCPQSIKKRQTDWRQYIGKALKDAHTLPLEFHNDVNQSLTCPVSIGMRLEIMDRTALSRNRIGLVDHIIAGRLRIRYEDSNDKNDGFWCHRKSTCVHPIGWSDRVGVNLRVKKGLENNYTTVEGFKNAGAEHLFAVPEEPADRLNFEVGMKLEAIDPLKLSNICVATIAHVLDDGYVMIGIDGTDDIENDKCFCHHRSSDSIFPAGFCKKNEIKLTLPNGYENGFDWDEYNAEKSAHSAPEEMFSDKVTVCHGFRKGMKLEAVDLMEPDLICVATVTRVIGNVLRVHFDGWEEDLDQWLSASSPNIFPVGWCELVGHELQPPNDSSKKSSSRTSSVGKEILKTESLTTPPKPKKKPGRPRSSGIAKRS